VAPQWAPFLALVAVLTLAVLGLARQSQRLLEAYGPDGGADSSRNEPGTTALPEKACERALRGPPTGAAPEDTDGLGLAAGRHQGQDPTREPASVPELRLTTGALLTNVAVTQGLVAAVVLVGAWYFAIPAGAFGVAAATVGLAAVGVGVAFGAVLWLGNELATGVADAVGAAYDEELRGMLAPDTAGGWLLLFAGVLPAVAVSEELLFRAALIGVPAAGYGFSPWPLAAVSSVAFALGHGAQGRVGVVVTGALGFVLAAGYVASGSLLLVVVAHYVINALEFLIHEGLDVEGVPGPMPRRQA